MLNTSVVISDGGRAVGETHISGAEWRVMAVLWDRKAATAAEVIADLAASGSRWGHRTVRTLLARLVAKGALAAVADGNRYLYRPLARREACVRGEGHSFLQKVFGGDAAELLAHFVRRSDISPAEVEELKRLLDAKRPPGGRS